MLDAAYEDSRKNRYIFSPTKCEVVIFRAAEDAADVVRYGFNIGGTALRLSERLLPLPRRESERPRGSSLRRKHHA